VKAASISLSVLAFTICASTQPAQPAQSSGRAELEAGGNLVRRRKQGLVEHEGIAIQ
jgi:hypothetical protein